VRLSDTARSAEEEIASVTRTLLVCAFAAFIAGAGRSAGAQERPVMLAVTRAGASDLRAWDQRID